MFTLKAFRALFHTGSFDFSNMRLCESFNIQTREELKISGVKFARPVRALAESDSPVFSQHRIGLVSQMASGKTTWSRSFLSTLLNLEEQDDRIYGCRIEHPTLGLVSHYDAFAKHARTMADDYEGSMASAARAYWEIYLKQVAEEQDCDRKGVTVSEHAALDDDQNFGYVWSFEEAATAKLYLAPELEGRAEIVAYVEDMRSLGF